MSPASRRRPASAPRWRRWIPIRRLGARHRGRLLGHLLALSERDRYLRFGFPADDAAIRRHVERIDFRRDEVFGIFNRRLRLVATSLLAYPLPDEGAATAEGMAERMAEFAVSVLPASRGLGYGAQLFSHAVRHLRNQGVSRLLIHALSENTAMLHIARQAGAVVSSIGGEREAWLQLPRHSLGSQVQERLDTLAADVSYGLRRQWRNLAGLWRRHLGLR